MCSGTSAVDSNKSAKTWSCQCDNDNTQKETNCKFVDKEEPQCGNSKNTCSKGTLKEGSKRTEGSEHFWKCIYKGKVSEECKFPPSCMPDGEYLISHTKYNLTVRPTRERTTLDLRKGNRNDEAECLNPGVVPGRTAYRFCSNSRSIHDRANTGDDSGKKCFIPRHQIQQRWFYTKKTPLHQFYTYYNENEVVCCSNQREMKTSYKYRSVSGNDIIQNQPGGGKGRCVKERIGYKYKGYPIHWDEYKIVSIVCKSNNQPQTQSKSPPCTEGETKGIDSCQYCLNGQWQSCHGQQCVAMGIFSETLPLKHDQFYQNGSGISLICSRDSLTKLNN